MHSWVVPLSKEWYAGDYAGLPGCVKSFQSTREMVETRIFKRNLVSCGKLEPPTRRLRERSEAILTQYHSLPTCCFVAWLQAILRLPGSVPCADAIQMPEQNPSAAASVADENT